MFYVVCYDIINDSLRQRLHDKLLGFGTRIQDSVFECLLDEELYARLLREIEALRLAKDDRVRVYKLCARCVEDVAIYGPGEVSREPEFYLV
ncbi:MAG TPA: CRISPR-associated endonuclease Cas2 [Bryobacteraceae bacterium]|nr:CRISPR-associated endonuclease Cas2 [Bryobacteraceae bacterium]